MNPQSNSSDSLPSEFTSSIGVIMIKVTAGPFMMGSAESEEGHRYWEQQREVILTRDYFLGRAPVTQSQYEMATGENPTDHPDAGKDAPVDSVNWHQANEFCRRLTDIDHEAGVLRDDWVYRLPTEAEWEYACRAGNPDARYGHPGSVAWYYDNAEGTTHPVCQKASNNWGFHDMLGNVWEWCQDWFHVANPRRAVRGGSYYNSAIACRAARREGWMPANRGRYCGVRVLAGPTGPLELSAPVDDFPAPSRETSIYDAIDADDFDLAERIITANPEALESLDEIPPPIHSCIYNDKPQMIKWLLDHGADIERVNQDYGATPLRAAIVMRRNESIPILIKGGANTEGAMDVALMGLAGEFEVNDLDREGYQEIVELLRELGIK